MNFHQFKANICLVSRKIEAVKVESWRPIAICCFSSFVVIAELYRDLISNELIDFLDFRHHRTNFVSHLWTVASSSKSTFYSMDFPLSLLLELTCEKDSLSFLR